MSKPNIARSLIAGVFLAVLLLSIPIVLVSSETLPVSEPTDPLLMFGGVELQLDDDGGIQALIDVYIKNTPNTVGAMFSIEYNSNYLEPSEFVGNAVISNEAEEQNSDFFSPNSDFTANGNNIFNENTSLSGVGVSGALKYSTVDTASSRISMGLHIDSTKLDVGSDTYKEVSKADWPGNLFGAYSAKTLYINSNNTIYKYRRDVDNEFVYLFVSHRDSVVKLGTLSFNVNPEFIEEMVASFGGYGGNDGLVAVTSDYLLRFSSSVTHDKWTISAINEHANAVTYSSNRPQPIPGGLTATTWFAYAFEKTMVKAEALLKILDLNAYQAFTDGDFGDVAALLQKYSPTVVVTYADGAMENHIFHWDNPDLPSSIGTVIDGGASPTHEYTVIKDGTGTAVDATNYVATGDIYVATQRYYHAVEAAGGGLELYPYPLPIEVRVEVEPITATGIAADKQHFSIGITQPNMTTYSTIGSLNLPGEVMIATDKFPGLTSLVMDIPSYDQTSIAALVPNGGITGIHGWPTVADVTGGSAIAKGAGVYDFTIPGGKVAKADIESEYPWLTVNDDFDYKATRTLLAPSGIHEDELYHIVHSVSTTSSGNEDYDYTNDGLKLELTVRRRTTLGAATYNSMTDPTTFKLYLPDGTEIESGWFSGADTASITSVYQSTSDAYYDLSYSPGITGALDSVSGAGLTERTNRAILRRVLNLGGWLLLEIQEDGMQSANRIPFYIEPRANQYQESVDYGFYGLNRGLFPYLDPMAERVTVPRGKFEQVDATGDLHNSVIQRYEVRTTYDGYSGVQPGFSRSFEVESPWASGPDFANLRTIFGATNFAAGGVEFAAYGEMFNDAVAPKTAKMTFDDDAVEIGLTFNESIKITPLKSGTASVAADGTVTAVFGTRTAGYLWREECVLVIENDGTTDIHGLYVDTQKDFDGSGDDKYLYGNYQIINPPSSFLPVGATTTMTIVYDYGLKPLDDSEPYLNRLYIGSNRSQVADGAPPSGYIGYFDAQFIVAASRVNKVSVVVLPEAANVLPDQIPLAEAWIIMGEHDEDGNRPYQLSGSTPEYLGLPTEFFMNYSNGSATYESERPVFIAVKPCDEYQIKMASLQYRVYYIDDSGIQQTIHHYVGGDGSATTRAVLEDGTFVFYFGMIERDVTIYIEMIEPDISKMRFEEVKLFAAAEKTNFATYTMAGNAPDRTLADERAYDADYEVDLYQKTYTQAELAGNPSDTVKATIGAAGTKGFSYQPNCNQYIAVVPADATVVGIETLIRHLEWLNTGVLTSDLRYNNVLSTMTVSMQRFVNTTLTGGTTVPVAPFATTNNTTTRKVNVSDTFAAPDKGKSIYVQITVTNTSTSERRNYFLEIVRAPGEKVGAADYGNSPFGMIMNQPAGLFSGSVTVAGATAGTNVTLTGHNAAKQHFINNGYRFDSTDLTPIAAKDRLTNTYHREAWAQLGTYDPDSAVDTAYYWNERDRYDNATTSMKVAPNNFDLDEYVLFLTIGKGFTDTGLKGAKDNSMRSITPDKVNRWVEVIAMDTTATKQSDRYKGIDTSSCTDYDEYIKEYRDASRTYVLELGTSETKTPADWAAKGYPVTGTVAAGAGSGAIYEGDPIYDTTVAATNLTIRPGVYTMVYEFYDYDAVETIRMYRTIIIIAPPGDVNADGKADDTDQTLYHNRVSDPLGFNAAFYSKGYANARTGEAPINKYRSTDNNNDRNVNNIDANTVANAWDTIVPYYLNEGYKYVAPVSP